MNARAANIHADAHTEAALRAAYAPVRHAAHLALVLASLRAMRLPTGDYPVYTLAVTRAPASHAVRSAVAPFAAHAATLIHAASIAAAVRGTQHARYQIQVKAPAALRPPIAMPPAPMPAIQGTYSQWPDLAAMKADQALTSGVILGHDPQAIADAMQAAMDIALIRAIVTARTNAMTAYRDAKNAVWADNPGLVIGWTWLAYPGACAACAVMDGSEHPSFERMESHPNCRCDQEPIFAPAMIA